MLREQIFYIHVYVSMPLTDSNRLMVKSDRLLRIIPPNRMSASRIPIIFGTNARVCSLICVVA